jgi:uncharacterized membrane protein
MVFIMTVPSNLCTAYLMKEEDVIFATLVLTVAPGISALIMGIHPIFKIYYEPITWTTILSLVIVFASVFVYKSISIYNYVHASVRLPASAVYSKSEESIPLIINDDDPV